MVQVVGRAWIWLWASDLENQGIQSTSQPASLSLLWLSPQTINESCFWTQAQISLKHVPVSWNSPRVYFKWRLCFSVHPLFWSILFVSIPIPLYGFMPLLLSTCHAHHYTFQPDSPDELQSDFSIGRMSKANYSGSTSLKRSANWSTGLLNTSRITGIKREDEGQCFEPHFLSATAFHIFQRIFHTFHSKWTLTRDIFSVLIYWSLQSLVSKMQSFKQSVHINHFLSLI